MKTTLAWIAKLWYIFAEQRLARKIEQLTNGKIAGESARTLARTWLIKRLQRHRGVLSNNVRNDHD